MMSETTDLIIMALVLVGIGAFSGVIAGLLGVGGGIVLVPAFFFTFHHLGYASDQLMQVCVATSLATIIITSLRSASGHNRKGAVDWEVLRTWAPGLIIGAFIGVFAALRVSSQVLLVVFGVLAAVVGLYMASGRNWQIAGEMPKGVVRAAASSILSFVSVLMGIGGGTFGVPLMTLFGFPIHRAVGTGSAFGVLIAVPSVLVFLFANLDPGNAPPYTIGAVNLPAFLLVVAVSYGTTQIGVKLAHALDPKPLKRLFGVFLIITALNMLRKAFGW
jgi:uncharacterized membrane protein YfcA